MGNSPPPQVHPDVLPVPVPIAAAAVDRGNCLFRIGFGYDVHQLVKGRRLILGGVHVPHPRGLAGHSDADVLVHAIIDAIFGALGMGDIGRHFPDSDLAYKDANSISLFKRVMTWAKKGGFRLNNLDATVVAERPKLASFIRMMQENIARAAEVSTSIINIKATSTERLGFCGRQEGIEAFAVVSLVGIEKHEEPDYKDDPENSD